jgi:hypothetical protein
MYLVIDICNSHSAFTIDLLKAYCLHKIYINKNVWYK